MIDIVLRFLKNHLNEQLSLRSSAAESTEDKVTFVNIAADGAMSLREGAVTLVLVNTEEDRTLRPADPYRVTGTDGSQHRVQPEISMVLSVLFIARFDEYDQSLSHISWTIRHFQSNRVLTSQNAPALDPRIGKLTMELQALTMQQQNDMWGMLKLGYQPSVLYRVKMVVFRDEPSAIPAVGEVDRQLTGEGVGT